MSDNKKEKDKLEDIAKSDIPFEIKGEKYFLSVLTIRDLADFRQYIKGEKIKLIQISIKDSEERIQLIQQVINSSVDQTLEMATMDGLCFLLWKSLSKRHKDLTLQKVDSMIDLDNINEVSAVLNQLGGKVTPPFMPKKIQKK